jgi:hypothetical protein
MKLATYLDACGPRVGLIEHDHLRPFPAGTTMRGLIDSGLDQAHPLADSWAGRFR